VQLKRGAPMRDSRRDGFLGDEMGAHLIGGEFQSDKYPTCPLGKVPLSVKDPTAQDLLWEYAQRRRSVDAEFSDDLEAALRLAGYTPSKPADRIAELETALRDASDHLETAVDACAYHFLDKEECEMERDYIAELKAIANGDRR
jgi:hypothetical protein